MLKIQTKTNKGINKEFSINMTNKTPLCILYEYANQVHKVSPRFEIEEKENPKDPFLAVCYINNDVCGRGTGNSKKTAKNNAGIFDFLLKKSSLIINIFVIKISLYLFTLNKQKKLKQLFAFSFPISRIN